MRIFSKVIILSLLALISGCLRGENQSVDQVLQNQKGYFNEKSKSVVLNESVKGTVSSISISLDKLEGSSDAGIVASTSETLAADLFGLITKAGFTSRPALTELINQYRVLSQNKDKVSAPAVKLLVARTYSALAAELDTTKFSL